MLAAAQNARVVYVTVGQTEEAETIASVVVGENLCACVNMVPNVRSFYRWDGKVQDDVEHLLIIKTLECHLEALYQRIRELHSYEVPEFIALPIEQGSADYLNWLHESVSPDS